MQASAIVELARKPCGFDFYNIENRSVVVTRPLPLIQERPATNFGTVIGYNLAFPEQSGGDLTLSAPEALSLLSFLRDHESELIELANQAANTRRRHLEELSRELHEEVAKLSRS